MLRTNTLGQRFILAIGFMALLTVLVSSIAIVNWVHIERRIQQILDTNFPVLQASYKLEHNITDLQTALYAINQYPKLEFNENAISIAKRKLDNIETLTIRISNNSHYVPLINNQQQLQRAFNLYFEDIKAWQHTRELEFHLKSQLRALQKKTHKALRIIQNQVNDEIIMDKKLTHDELQAYIAQLSKLIQLRQYVSQLHREITDTFIPEDPKTIEQSIHNITKLIQQLQTTFNTLNNHHQLSELNKLLQTQAQLLTPTGRLFTLLTRCHELKKKNLASEHKINHLLLEQAQYSLTVTNEIKNFAQHQYQQAKQQMTWANMSMGIVLLITLITAILFFVLLIKRGLITRLNKLSEHLTAIGQGRFDVDITLDGQDEIGQLGNKLREFCEQQQALTKSNAVNLINKTDACIITCDNQGTIESITPKAQELFQLSALTDICMPYSLWTLFQPSEQAQIRVLFTPSSQNFIKNSYFRKKVMLEKNKNKRYLQLDICAFQQNNGIKWIATISDITEQEINARWLEQRILEKTTSLQASNQQLITEVEERKRIEADLRTTQNELIQAAKMAVVGQTMTTMAHELNQPLSALNTYLFTAKLSLDKSLNCDVKKSLLKMEELTDRMSSIITNLRSFAKKQQIDAPLVAVNLHHSVEQASELLKSKIIKNRIHIDNQLPNHLMVQATAVQLEQVFVNLFMNSCDSVMQSPQREIEIYVLNTQNNHLTIGIKDTGQGFPSDIIERLFTPFITTKPVGLGLGLNICRTIMTTFHGQIYLASSLQQGALIVLELNYAQE